MRKKYTCSKKGVTEVLEAALLASRRTVVQEDEAFPNGGIGLGKRESVLSQLRQDETLGDNHATLDLGLVLRVAHA